MSNDLVVTPITGIGEVRSGDDLAALVTEAIGAGELHDDDVVVIAHKAVSKSEGRVVPATSRLETALAESRRVLRRAGDMVISETHHGFVCANAGVDASNVEGDNVVLLPRDPDLSARRLRTRIRRLTGARVAVVISDTFGRAWRLGQTNVAIGVAGMDPFVDLRGRQDAQGRVMTATLICVADEIAGAAEMVMGKTEGVCAARVRGARFVPASGAAAAIVRPAREDLFR